MLPDPAGSEPATSWSPVGRAAICDTDTTKDGLENMHAHFT